MTALRTPSLPTVIAGPGIGDFDATKRTRFRNMTLPRAGSADSHRTPRTRDMLRRDSQRALRNDYLARSLVKRVTDTVVGDRIGIQVKSESADFNAAAEKFLNRWAERDCDHNAPVGDGTEVGQAFGAGRNLTQMARLAVRSGPRDGNLFVLPTPAGRLQLIEDELVRDPVLPGAGWGGGAWGGGLAGVPMTGFPGVRKIIGGVCFDADSRVCGYSVSQWDPRTGNTMPGAGVRFVPAKDMIHLRNPVDDEVNLVRPEPGLTAILDPLRDLRGYITDTAIAAKIALLFGLVVQSAMPDKMQGALPTPAMPYGDTFDSDRQYPVTYAELEPGYILNLGLGEQAQQVKPEHPTQTFSDYVVTNLALICAEQGLPLALWSLDFRQVNFSSAKGSVTLYYATTVAVWRQWLRTSLLGPVCRWRLAMALRNGEIPGIKPRSVPDDWDAMQFLFPPPPSLDPLGYAEAEVYQVSNGLKTFRDAVEATGKDYDAMVRELLTERPLLNRLGIMTGMKPGQVAQGQGGAKGDLNAGE